VLEAEREVRHHGHAAAPSPTAVRRSTTLERPAGAPCVRVSRRDVARIGPARRGWPGAAAAGAGRGAAAVDRPK
jgi:hypothetical protein